MQSSYLNPIVLLDIIKNIVKLILNINILSLF